jgi:hypothetical protein
MAEYADAVPLCRLRDFVMAGLRPGHPRLFCLAAAETWMPGTSPGTMNFVVTPYFIGRFLSQQA